MNAKQIAAALGATVILGYALGYHAGHIDTVAELGPVLAEYDARLTVGKHRQRGEQTIPVCSEDQVITFDGVCVTPGDAYVEYVGGLGWKID